MTWMADWKDWGISVPRGWVAYLWTLMLVAPPHTELLLHPFADCVAGRTTPHDQLKTAAIGAEYDQIRILLRRKPVPWSSNNNTASCDGAFGYFNVDKRSWVRDPK
jgi:hypothetical protein